MWFMALTKIRQRNFQDWPKNIQRRLRALTFREVSGMRDAIYDSAHTDHKTFVLFENEEPVAWAFAIYDHMFAEYDIMLYTRRDRRRMGYGRRLFNRAQKWVEVVRGMPIAFYPDECNRKFFKKVAGSSSKTMRSKNWKEYEDEHFDS